MKRVIPPGRAPRRCTRCGREEVFQDGWSDFPYRYMPPGAKEPPELCYACLNDFLNSPPVSILRIPIKFRTVLPE